MGDNMNISSEVSKLEQNYEDMKNIAGEIIATLIIQNNKKLFDHMPPEWFSIIETWEKKFREISKEDPYINEFKFQELESGAVFNIIDSAYEEYIDHVFVRSAADSYGKSNIPFNCMDIHTARKYIFPTDIRVKLIK